MPTALQFAWPRVTTRGLETLVSILNHRMQELQQVLTFPKGLTAGLTTGWTASEQAAFVNTAYTFFGVKNLGLLGLTQTNYAQFLGHDDNNTVPNIVSLYAALTDNHASGTRASSVGFEGDMFHTGTGTTTGESGLIGFHTTSAGIVTTQLGVQGQVKVTGGTVTDSAGVYGIVLQSGGAVTNSYAGYFPGPSRTGGTVVNNYGVYIGSVGTAGSSTNYPLYIVTTAGAVTIDTAGPVSLPSTLTVTGLLTATLATAAQPNVTSVGTLTGLTVSSATASLTNGAADVYWTIQSTAAGGRQYNLAAAATASGNIPGAGFYVYDVTGTAVVLSIDAAKNVRFPGGFLRTVAAQESTGTGTAALGANCPAATLTAPYTWLKIVTSDGSTVYVPAWK